MAMSPRVRKMTRLRQEVVEFILNRGRLSIDPRFEKMEDSYEEFTCWVRAEYAARGFVEVDDEYLAARSRNVAAIAQFFEDNFTDDSEDEEGGFGDQDDDTMEP